MMAMVTLVPVEDEAVAREVLLVPVEEESPAVAVDDSAWSISGPRGVVAGAKQAGRDVANTYSGLAARTGGMMANFGQGLKFLAGDALNKVGVENDWPQEAKEATLANDQVLDYINREEFPVESGVGQALRGATDSTVLMAPGMAAGPLALATRAGAAALRGTTVAPATVREGIASLGRIMPATLGMQAGVSQYGKKRSQDVPVLPAALSAGVTGGAEYGFERISTDALLKVITGGADNFVANLGKYFGKEIATELPTTVVQSLADLVFDKDVTPQEAAERGARYLDIFRNQVVETSSGEKHQIIPELVDTAGQTAILAGTVGAGGRVAGMAWDALAKPGQLTREQAEKLVRARGPVLAEGVRTEAVIAQQVDDLLAAANATTPPPPPNLGGGVVDQAAPLSSEHEAFEDFETMPEPRGPLARAAAQVVPAEPVLDLLAPGQDLPVMVRAAQPVNSLLLNDDSFEEGVDDGGVSGVSQEVGGAAQALSPMRSEDVRAVTLTPVEDDPYSLPALGVRMAELTGAEESPENVTLADEFLAANKNLANFAPAFKERRLLEFVEKKKAARAKLEVVNPTLPTPLDALAHEAATSPVNDKAEPTLAQIEAGNYAKGHISLHGMNIAIENPAGSVRKGVDETGRAWETKLSHHYGYIKGTLASDGDHVDVFVKPGIDQSTAGDKVFVVDQKDLKSGKFDESKVMIGFPSAAVAREAYLSNYDKQGPERILDVSAATVDGFKLWLKTADTTKPFSPNALMAAKSAPLPSSDLPKRLINYPSLARAAKGLGLTVSTRDLQGFFVVTDANKAVIGRTKSLEEVAELLEARRNPVDSPPLPAPKARSAKQLAAQKARNTINPASDDLLMAIRKLGGLDKAQVLAQWGKSAVESDYLSRSALVGKPVLRNKAGLPLDRMLSSLKGHGYLAQDASLHDFEELFLRSAAGEAVLTDSGDERAADALYESEMARLVGEMEASQAEELVQEIDPDFASLVAGAPELQGMTPEALEWTTDVFNDILDGGLLLSADDYVRSILEESDDEGTYTGRSQGAVAQSARETESQGSGAAAEGVDAETPAAGVRSEVTPAGDQLKMFATPPTFGRKAKPKGDGVTSLDLSLAPEEVGLFDAKAEVTPVSKVTSSPTPTNTVFTEDAYLKAKALMKSKLDQLSAGIDPELMQAGFTIAGYHIEKGTRSFTAYATAMIEDFGDKIKPYLKSFYNGVRDLPGIEAITGEMDSYSVVAGVDVAELGEKPPAPEVKVPESEATHTSPHFAAGQADFKAGKPRVLPSYFTTATGKNPKDWYRGWDQASLDAPLPVASAPESAILLNEKEQERAEAGDDKLPGHGVDSPADREAAGTGAAEVAGATGGRAKRNAAERPGGRRSAGATDGGGSSLEPAVSATGAGAQQRQERGAGDGSEGHDRLLAGNRGVNYRISAADQLGKGNAKQKARDNIAAIRLVKQLTLEERPATMEEQALLVKYSGWGASELANGMFPFTGYENNRYRFNAFREGWEELGNELKELLPAEEYAAAQRSTMSAFYTPADIVSGMYGALEQLGFKGGRLLEPGTGVGHFIGMLPDSFLASTRVTGVELDNTSAAIAKLLYPGHDIRHQGFEKFTMPDGFYDVAIGNPPFVDLDVTSDPAYARHKFKLHDYFFAKALDKVRPGGLLMFVTSKGTMDKANDKARAYLAKSADLLGAIRLPETAFKENAGTETVTDVIFLRKRLPGEAAGGQAWSELKEVQTPDGPTWINEYFADHVSMVLGRNAITSSQFGPKYTVLPDTGTTLGEQFNFVVRNFFPEKIYTASKVESPADRVTADFDLSPENVKEGGYYLDTKGTVLSKESGVGKPVEKNGKDLEVIRSYIPLRDAVRQVLYVQVKDGDLAGAQQELKKAYNAFVKKHGIINHESRSITTRNGKESETVRTPNFSPFRDDPDAYLVASIESYNDESNTAQPGQIFTERTIKPEVIPQINSIEDALHVVMHEDGRIDMAQIAAHMNVSEEQAIDALGTAVYHNPATAQWETDDEYLSGNVKQKLAMAQTTAQADPQYQRNVDALTAVQPEDLPPSRITINLGSPILLPEHIELFAEEVIGMGIKVSYLKAAGDWQVVAQSGYATAAATSDWGTSRRDAATLLAAALNSQQVRVESDVSDGNGGTRKAFDKDATEAAIEKLVKIKQRFATWWTEDPERMEALARSYNDTFNTTVKRVYGGAHIDKMTFPGMSAAVNPFEHQKRVAWRIVQSGNTYMAHSVGAGKTIGSILAGMELKRLGIKKKPCWVVPNHMLKQFAAEFLQLYPAAKILVADEAQFNKENRNRFMGRVAAENWDGVIITHSAFGLMPLSPEFASQFIEEQISDLEYALSEVDKGDRLKRKQIERAKARLEQRLAKIMSAERKDKGVNFEETGIDQIFVDEAHEFRKLDFTTNQSNIKGIDPNGSLMAFDLYAKTRYLETLYPGRSLVMMSGTPITNTIGEIYTVQRFLQGPALEAAGIDNFDAWAAQYGDMATKLEATPAGNYKPVTRFARFTNLSGLAQMWGEIGDFVHAKNLSYVKRPKVKSGGRIVVTSEQSDRQRSYKNHLASRIKAIEKRKGPPNKGDDILLSVITDGRHAALDERYIDAGAKVDAKENKLEKMVANVATIWKETKKERSTQMIFADLGLPGSEERRGFSAYKRIKEALVAQGIPAAEIAFMQDYKKSDEKQKLFKAMNEGRMRVLIGSSEAMGTGVNAQRKLIALHHLDPDTYLPSNIEQREGRIVRQGNTNEEVQLYTYATRGSYDEAMWQFLETKQRFIDQFLAGDASSDEASDVDGGADSFAQARALSSDNPLVLERAGIEADLQRLESLRRAHFDDQQRLRIGVLRAEKNIPEYRKELTRLETVIARRVDTAGDKFRLTLKGTTFEERKKAGEALVKLVDKLMAAKETLEWSKVGEVAGLDIMARAGVALKMPWTQMQVGANGTNSPLIQWQGLENAADIDPVGLAMKLENLARSFDKEQATVKDELQRNERLLAEGQARIGRPFEHVQSLADKKERLEEIETTLKAQEVGEEESGLEEVPKYSTGRQTILTGDSGLGKVTVTPAKSLPFIGKALAKENAEQVVVKGGNVEALRKVAQGFGKNIIFFRMRDAAAVDAVGRAAGGVRLQSGGAGRGADAQGTGGGAILSANETISGFINPAQPNLIFLNVDAPNHLLYIAGHEVGHALKMQDSALWAEMEADLQPLIRNWSHYRDSMPGQYGTLAESEKQEELLADVIGHHFLNENFWSELAQENKSLFTRIAKKALELLNKALRLLTGMDVRTYISDMTQARAIIAKTLLQYGENVNKGLYGKFAEQADLETLDNRLMGASVLEHLRAEGFSEEKIGAVLGLSSAKWAVSAENETKYSIEKGGETKDQPRPDKKQNIVRETVQAMKDLSPKAVLQALRPMLNPLQYGRLARTVAEEELSTDMKYMVGFVPQDPYWKQAEADPAAEPFYEEGKRREEERFDFNVRMRGSLIDGKGTPLPVKEKLKRLATWDDQHTQWEETKRQYLYPLNKAERTALAIIVDEGNIREVEYTSLAKALQNKEIAKAGLNARAFAMYQELNKAKKVAFDAGIDIEAEIMEEIGIAPEKIKDSTAGKRSLSKGRVNFVMEMKSGEFVASATDVNLNVISQLKRLADEFGIELTDTATGERLRYGKQIASVQMTFAAKDEARAREDLSHVMNNRRIGYVHRDHGNGDQEVMVHRVIDQLDFKESKIVLKNEVAGVQFALPYYPGGELAGKMADVMDAVEGSYWQTAKGEIILQVEATYAEQARELLAEIPLTREDGSPYKVKFYSRFVGSVGEAGSLVKTVRGDLKTHLRSLYDETANFEVSTMASSSVKEEEFSAAAASSMALDHITAEGLKQAIQRGEIDKKDAETLLRKYRENVAEIMLSRGAGAAMIRRVPYLIEGFDRDNPIENFEGQLNATAGMLSKAIYAMRQFKHMTKAPPTTRRWATSYIEAGLRNMTIFDQLGGTVRAGLAIRHLGGNFLWGVINHTQPFLVGWGELSRHIDGGDFISREQGAMRRIMAAERDVVFRRLSDEEKALFRDSRVKVQLEETVMGEMAGSDASVGGLISRGLHSTARVTMWHGHKVEILNRKVTILAAYRTFKSQGLTVDKALTKALKVNEATNIAAGRFNLTLAQGHHSWVRTASALQSFVKHILNMIYYRMTSGKSADQKALLRMFFMMALFGGVPVGLIGGDELDELILKMFGYSPKQAIRSWLHKFAKNYENLADLIEGMFWHGGPGAGGASLTGSLMIRTPVIGGLIDGRDWALALTGPAGGLVADTWDIGEYLLKKNYRRAGEIAIPLKSVGNAVKAEREYREGMTTAAGKPTMYQGRQLKLTGKEAIMRGMGVQPAKVADVQEFRGFQFGLEKEWSERRQLARDQYRQTGDMKYVWEFNKALMKSQAWGGSDQDSLVKQLNTAKMKDEMKQPKDEQRFQRRNGPKR